jgi:PAS domain-containing protein
MRSNAVALRVFRIALVTSLVFLLLSTAFIYMLEYRQRSSIIESEVEIHYEAQATGIVEALWDYDYDLLRILADGLGFYPYINYVAIEDARGIVAESGSTKDDSASRSYALVRRAPGRDDLVLGTLLIQIDSSRIRSDVVEQILVSVVFQALFLATISLIVFVLFSRMVTRHLARIAAHISEADIHPGAEPLTLDKRNHGDELDILVRSFNEMHRNVQNAHEAQTRAMEELRLSEEKSRVLVEEAPDAILMYDYEGGVFTSCNRQAAILFGRSR